MINIINYPYNAASVARLDNENIVHNHVYHNCPIGKVNNNIIYNSRNYPIGRVDENGIIHNHVTLNRPIGKVCEDGFVYDKNNLLIGRIDGDSPYCAGAAFLLLIHGNR